MDGRARGGRRRRGVTLIEVAIALSVAGVLAMAGLPRIADALRSARVNAAARVVAGDLELALSIAARDRRPMRLDFDAPSTSYRLGDRALGGVLQQRFLGRGSEWGLDSIATSPVRVELFPGGLTSANVLVRLYAGNHARRVTMTRAGLVRVVPP